MKFIATDVADSTEKLIGKANAQLLKSGFAMDP